MKDFGNDAVVAADLKPQMEGIDCKQYKLDVTDFKTYNEIVEKEKITYIVHYAAILSSLGEINPDLALSVNFYGFFNAINIAREHKCQIMSPSSIAAYGGPNFSKDKTPLVSVMEPETMYGVSKVSGELLGAYYNKKFGLDFRGVRYPGIISSAKYDFNGTTDFPTRKYFL